MTPLNWFDVALLVILFVSVFTGLRAGLARVVIGLAATAFGCVLGFWCYRIVGAKLMPYVSSSTVANVLGFLAIFGGVLILGSLLSALLSGLFRRIGLSWFNHFLGGVAGFVRGVLVIAALADILVAFSPSPNPTFLARSRVLPYASELSLWLVSIAPRELQDAYGQQMQNLKHLWAAPANRHETEA
ncbi:MAG TPA: CvpA family protein [Bryobacteraceae bacterium]|jgi:membrane protein required for colicin V production|nr:CvpA family protein [Bryobacteraceae bacterium]